MKNFLTAGCFWVVAALSSAHGATICSGRSAGTAIDIATGVRTAVLPELIRYSTAWVDGAAADATAVVDVDGELLNAANGNGAVVWAPERNGTYTLTHKVMSSGAQVGETFTATFVVEGLEPDNPVISPANGTVFVTSLPVAITSPTEGATIHYTTDGSDPTVESPVYRRFRIYGKTTVKAVAVKDGMLSKVTTAEYALGRCADPAISLADGASFEHSNKVVSIRWNNDGVLRYTLDGSEPTADSPIYEEPFSFSESVVVKAKVFSDEFFDSATMTSRLTRIWKNVSTPQITAVTPFTGSKTKVVISCATDGALVRYTLDGSEPNSHSTKYTMPFYVTDSCTVKAYAVKSDYRNSRMATQEIVKSWGIGDSLGKPDHTFTTYGSGGVGWESEVDPGAPNGKAMISGAIVDGQTSVLETKVTGPGRLTFSWRTSCEEDPEGTFEWDHAEFAVDGKTILRLDGEKGWKRESVQIEGDGEHTITWTYRKDDVAGDGEDAAWVAGYAWESAWTETKTTDVPVPYSWLLGHDPEIVDEYDAYEAAAKQTGANGLKAWESYVIGANPNDPADTFRIVTFPMNHDGTPDLANLAFSPAKDKWNLPGAKTVLKGKVSLGSGEWQTVTEDNKKSFRFFRVEVQLP